MPDNKANQPPPPDDHGFLLERKSFIKDLFEQIHDAFAPPKQPDLVLESKPIPVKDIWAPPKSLRSRLGSVLAHVAVIGILMLPFWNPVRTQIQKVVTQEIFLPTKPVETVIPMRRMSGGGTPAVTPKLVQIQTPKPTSMTAPTAIVPIAESMNMPSFGAIGPIAGPPGAGGGSNGGPGGIGSGNEGGTCLGANCGSGSGVAATAPIAVFSPDPEYSDEARKAKFQGTCTVEVEIDAQGRVHNPHVTGPLGLGLDQKAVEAVLKWRFVPAKDKNGRPIASIADIEVNFRLY